MIRWWVAVWLVVSAVALAVPEMASAAPPAPAEGRVSAITIEGLDNVEEATVRAAMTLRRGDTLTTERVRRDLKALYATGFFDDVRLLRREPGDGDDGGVVLVVRLAEKPAVREVYIQGNSKVGDEDIQDVIGITAYSVLNDAEVQRNVERIRDVYLDKGFYLAEIEPVIETVADDEVELTFSITEGTKVRVQRIDFAGNDNLPSSRLRQVMQTKVGGVLPWLLSTGNFKEELLEQDRQILQYLYYEEGYLEARIGAPNVFLSPDKRFIYISFTVEEGPRYDIGDINIVGDFVEDEGLTEDNVRRILDGTPVLEIQEELWLEANELGDPVLPGFRPRGPRLASGDPFKASVMSAAAQQVQSFYQDQGYAFANVVPNPIPRANAEDGAVADLLIQIDKGEKYRIGQIHITGNDPTLDKVVRREILLDEGDLFRGGLLAASRARIFRLGYFDQVDIETPRGLGDRELDVNVRVSEQPTGSFSLGLGFSSIESFVFTANISKNNVFGLGSLVNFSANVSALRLQLQLDYFEPYLADSRWTLRFNGYVTEQQFQLNEFRRGFSLEIGRYLDRRDDIRLAASYTLEQVGLNTLDAYRRRAFGGQLYKSGITSTIGVNFNLDKRNNRILATRGFLINAAANLSGGFRLPDGKVLSLLGGDFHFAELRFNARLYQPFLLPDDKLVFRVNSTLGWQWSTDGQVIPFIHRYRAGGINSVRGFPWFSLGPGERSPAGDDPALGDERIIVGGTSTWINNIEVEFRVLPQAGITLVGFFDAGNAFGGPWGGQGIDVMGLRTSVGGGVRWQSPIGPLRFEIGWPLDPQPGEQPSQFDFTIGSFF